MEKYKKLTFAFYPLLVHGAQLKESYYIQTIKRDKSLNVLLQTQSPEQKIDNTKIISRYKFENTSSIIKYMFFIFFSNMSL